MVEPTVPRSDVGRFRVTPPVSGSVNWARATLLPAPHGATSGKLSPCSRPDPPTTSTSYVPPGSVRLSGCKGISRTVPSSGAPGGSATSAGTGTVAEPKTGESSLGHSVDDRVDLDVEEVRVIGGERLVECDHDALGCLVQCRPVGGDDRGDARGERHR